MQFVSIVIVALSSDCIVYYCNVAVKNAARRRGATAFFGAVITSSSSFIAVIRCSGLATTSQSVPFFSWEWVFCGVLFIHFNHLLSMLAFLTYTKCHLSSIPDQVLCKCYRPISCRVFANCPISADYSEMQPEWIRLWISPQMVLFFLSFSEICSPRHVHTHTRIRRDIHPLTPETCCGSLSLLWILWGVGKITEAMSQQSGRPPPYPDHWCPHLHYPPLLRWMPFLPQPFQFILALNRHQICWIAYLEAWFIYSLSHRLQILTAVPRSTLSSIFCWMVKWISAYGLDNNNKL